MMRAAKKSLYVFLSVILGILLFITLHRAVALLYFFLAQKYPTFNLGLSSEQIWRLDAISFLVMFFLGGWYGVWIGLYWYGLVYEQAMGSRCVALLKKVTGWMSNGTLVFTKKPRTTELKEFTEPEPWQFDDLKKPDLVFLPKQVTTTEPQAAKLKKPVRPVEKKASPQAVAAQGGISEPATIPKIIRRRPIKEIPNTNSPTKPSSNITVI